MASLIRHGRIVHEAWQRLEADAEVARTFLTQPQPGVAGALIPLGLWAEQARNWIGVQVPLGVLLRGDEAPDALLPDLARVPVIAIQFPRFADGRGYSLARILRCRHGYRGELRAVGDVLRDQVFYMSRVGFDAFELRADQDAEAALAALHDFSERYQAGADQPLPLFRRRVA
jgi:uncharacterized protein (DUF934 family)